MANGIIGNVGLSALRAASRVMNNSAHQVANVNTADFKTGASTLSDMAPGVRATIDPGGQTITENKAASDVSLAGEVVTQIGAQGMYQANLASLRTEDEVLGTAIDIKR